ncbi:gluconokinase, GntK/IdnK-type [Demequina sp. B12]|uniref:gluconokinase n=1 Tax=Demequina sp. B12 TaxID=2992757 RepID=UPI00237AE677|nr:gluconokinase, GntK/IdnK-type [Demequina sp. B12]MDE0572891.1 gluconokinase, GntK/IdnK-type [Demequina sp. B12]
MRPVCVVVAGPAASGKSVVGADLASRWDVPFIDADDLHPARNRTLMAAGTALTDDDRWPWLAAVGQRLSEASADGGGVLACSALKADYRDRIRVHVPHAWFAVLTGDAATLSARAASRSTHFMPASLVPSQMKLLEPLRPDERGAMVDVTAVPAAEVAAAVFSAYERDNGATPIPR